MVINQRSVLQTLAESLGGGGHHPCERPHRDVLPPLPIKVQAVPVTFSIHLWFCRLCAQSLFTLAQSEKWEGDDPVASPTPASAL